jgi:hypothetical protein
MIYYLNIGTNLGDRCAHLRHAIAALSAGNGGCMVSPVIESAPWGFVSSNNFLNVGVAIVSELAPRELLEWLHDIERRLGSASHRDWAGGYVDRVVDIDIMAIDDNQGHEVHVDQDYLQVPHPHLNEREFFLTPLRALAGRMLPLATAL